jgi:hypothetical protein
MHQKFYTKNICAFNFVPKICSIFHDSEKLWEDADYDFFLFLFASRLLLLWLNRKYKCFCVPHNAHLFAYQFLFFHILSFLLFQINSFPFDGEERERF